MDQGRRNRTDLFKGGIYDHAVRNGDYRSGYHVKDYGGTGQTEVLANGIASVLGKVYVILSPFIGLLGSFMTGSNMSSNILFAGFQSTTAHLLDVNSSIVLGAQSAGGSIGSAISPSNIVLGTTTANILGSEGNVLKKIIVITVPAALVIGVLVLALTSL